MSARLFTLLSCLLLAACASTGPDYQPADSERDTGYRTTRLADDRYRVAFTADPEASTTARDYALLRAAELTLQKGYDWFEVANRDTAVSGDDDDGGATLSATRQTTTDCGLLGCSSTTRTMPSAGVHTELDSRGRSVSTVEFVMGEGRVPEGASYYEAREVAVRIRGEYFD